MMRVTRFTAIMLAILLITSFLFIPVSSAEILYSGEIGVDDLGNGSTNIQWALDDSGTLAFAGSGTMKDALGDSYDWGSYADTVEEILIDEGIINIPSFAFWSFDSLIDVAIPNGVELIGRGAFQSSYNLESVMLSETVTYIDAWAFDSCANLRSITLPSNIATIENNAIGRTGLSSITIPNSSVSLGDAVFKGSSLLTSITFLGDTPPNNILSTSFSDIPSQGIIYCPMNSIDAYTAWKNVTSGLQNWEVRRIGDTGPQPTDVELNEIIDNLANMDADDILKALEDISNLDDLLDSKENVDKLKEIENKYNDLVSINAKVSIDENTHGNFKDSNVSVVGLSFNGDPPPSLIDLHFSKPAQDTEIDGTRYKKNTMVQVDIKAINEDETELGTLKVPIAITVSIPSGIEPENFVILHYFADGSGYEILRPRINSDGTCTFIVTRFSTFIFVNAFDDWDVPGIGVTQKKSDDSPTPIVPVLYDFVKTGDSFSFKVIVANAPTNLAGSTVTVRLNEKYSTTVTIGQDGVGFGVIEAPAFSGSIANFSARVNAPGAVNVTTPMVIYSDGRVVRKQ